MTDAVNLIYETIDEQHAERSAHTRRQLVKGAAATLGATGLLSALSEDAHASFGTPAQVLTVAATAEVLATIVNTLGAETVDLGDDVTRRNVRAAAREELIHYRVLVSPAVRGRPATKRVWVPDAVFSSRTSFLSALEVGEQILCNAYLIATTVFGYAHNGFLARVAAEFMGVEAVHRALARQSLGKLGSDRAFVKFAQRERTDNASPNPGQPGFTDILDAVRQLQAAGFGFGRPGATPGRFYDFDEVRRRNPTDPPVNTVAPA